MITLVNFKWNNLICFATFFYNGEEHFSAVWEQNGFPYVNTGNVMDRNLVHHNFNRKQIEMYNRFLKRQCK